MSQQCFQCGRSFQDFQALALHIMANKNHRKGRKWAAKLLMKNKLQRELPHRIAETEDKHTEMGDENRANAKRILTGETEYVHVICPKCHLVRREQLPTEYTESRWAWRIKETLAVLCAQHTYLRQ